MNGENNDNENQRRDPQLFYTQKPAKLPEVPNLSLQGAVQPRRDDPFRLSDFRGVDAQT